MRLRNQQTSRKLVTYRTYRCTACDIFHISVLATYRCAGYRLKHIGAYRHAGYNPEETGTVYRKGRLSVQGLGNCLDFSAVIGADISVDIGADIGSNIGADIGSDIGADIGSVGAASDLRRNCGH